MNLIPPQETDGRLRIKFVITSMPVGGAETLLMNLIRSIDQSAFAPEVVCLKEPGVLGEELAGEVPVYANLLTSKWDLSVLPRLAYLLRRTGTHAVITVGAGDKMFWGRLAAKLAGVPVICSALHSTGWPDGVGRLNRWLTPLTDAFIAVARPHAEHLAVHEKFPPRRIFMIPNGVDANRFRPNHAHRTSLREELGISEEATIVSMVAALRPEKNHEQLLTAAHEVLRQHPQTHFLIVGEGPERIDIEQHVNRLGLQTRVHLLGSRSDTERILAGSDLFCLTSRNEANPVSILEALATCLPVVAPDVGSIRETVLSGRTGFLTKPLCAEATADALLQLMANPSLAAQMGRTGRQLVRQSWSLTSMVQGYESLVESTYNSKAERWRRAQWQRPAKLQETVELLTTAIPPNVELEPVGQLAGN